MTTDEIESNEEEAVLCRACSATITSRRFKVEIEGKHQHTFFNPAGIIFEIGCFAEAPGCDCLGEPSTYFAWFAGYSWRFAICGSCRTHLGWQFLAEHRGSFFGLILDRLVEESTSH